MVRIPNPFYGVGLAVHRYSADCPECGLTVFLDTEHPDPNQDPAARRGLFAWWSRAAARRKAARTTGER
jgi:hypothetical protein